MSKLLEALDVKSVKIVKFRFDEVHPYDLSQRLDSIAFTPDIEALGCELANHEYEFLAIALHEVCTNAAPTYYRVVNKEMLEKLIAYFGDHEPSTPLSEKMWRMMVLIKTAVDFDEEYLAYRVTLEPSEKAA